MQYEDFDLNDDRLCYDAEMGIVYQDHSERNKDRRVMEETSEKVVPKSTKKTIRNSVCRIVDGKGEVWGTGFLVDLLGHRCIMTGNNIVPSCERANKLFAEFCIEGSQDETMLHLDRGKYEHPFSSTIRVQLRPDCLFLTNVSLNFTLVDFDSVSPCESSKLDAVQLPALKDKPSFEPEKKKETPKKGEKTAENARATEAGEETPKPRRKRNFIIVKKKDRENSALGGAVDAKKKTWNFPRKNDIVEIVGFPLRKGEKRSDIQLIDSVEGSILIYKMDTDLKASGSPVFFNSKLVAVHNQSDLKDNADEATVIFSILEYIYSHRVESIGAFGRAAIARTENKAAQRESSTHFLQFARDSRNANQLVKAGAISALLNTCRSCFDDPFIVTNALEALYLLCKWRHKNLNLLSNENGTAIVLNLIAEDEKHHFEHIDMLHWAWGILGYVCEIPACAHEVVECNGPHLVVKSMYSEVKDTGLVLGGLKAITCMARDEKHHAMLMKAKVVSALFLVTGVHEESEVIQLAGVVAMHALLANSSAMPANSSFIIDPVRQSGMKKKDGRKKKDNRELKVPLRNGKRDRQLMKRNKTATIMAVTAEELGGLVQIQPRALVMWEKNGLGTLFAAMKNFPASVPIAENVWAALVYIKEEGLSRTDTHIELHGAHLHVMKKNLRRMKNHPNVEKWRELYTVLDANNTRKKKKIKKKIIVTGKVKGTQTFNGQMEQIHFRGT